MTPRISMLTLFDRLTDQGLVDEKTARRVLHATLAVLGERLVVDEARALAEALPAELAALVLGSEYDADFSADELFERVRRRAREPRNAAHAREAAEIVLAVLGECLDPDRRRRIARGLPGQAAELLLGGRELGEPPPHRMAPLAPEIATLASSRPGSTHPLYEAAPPSGHMHSVARNPSPHAETKLSGAKGLTQERLDDTLGSGRPPAPARPLADAGRK
jgi:uncharacterized protein (DUF2267 family)